MTRRPDLDADADQAAEVMSLLRRQCALYRALKHLARRQRALITQEDSAPLLEVLGQRQKLTHDLVELNRQLAPYRDAWALARESLAPGDRGEADRIVSEVSDLLKGIIEEDEHDARLLSARKSQTAAALQANQAERQTVSAYAAVAAGPAGARFDQISEES
ncbi:MAG: flagellar export chaperone FlgN [Planctomycetes bacterium]|nr:flagellar export chaperone FlgN [Planctomycetota bacterium]